MSLVGALLFCNDCGGLLERCPASQANIDCDVCGKRNQSKPIFLNLTSDTKEKAERAKMPSTHVQNPERALAKNRKTDILQIKHPKSLVS